MHPHDILRTFGEVRDLVDVQRRRVRRQNGTWFHHRVELLEDGFLDLEFLEDRLDHEVALAQV